MSRLDNLETALVVAKEFAASDLAKRLESEIKKMKRTPEEDELIQDLVQILETSWANGYEELAVAILDRLKEKKLNFSDDEVITEYSKLTYVPDGVIVFDKQADMWFRYQGVIYLKCSSDEQFYNNGSSATAIDGYNYGPFTVSGVKMRKEWAIDIEGFSL